jgi:O-antigen ligase
LGHGTGAWAVNWGGMDEAEYPHNIVLEALYEEGMIGLSVLLLFIWIIFRRWRQASVLINYYGLSVEQYQYTHIAGLLFLFSLIQAMKSNDLDGNRLMFFCAGLVVATFSLARRRVEEISSESEPGVDGYQQLEEVDFQDTQVLY